MSRVAGKAIYQQQQDEVTAKLYNLWRRAKLHFKFPIRFPLIGYRGLVMILDEDEWLCIDENNNDMPIICWLDFVDQGRDALHVPVKCTRNYYHFAADKIREHVLELTEEELDKMLHQTDDE